MMNKHQHHINSEIAYTHLLTRKKQTIVAALGVTIGIAIFIFMNSLMSGFEAASVESLFKSTPHLRIYKDDVLSRSLVAAGDSTSLHLISNPKITGESNRIINPFQLIQTLRKQAEITGVTPNVTANAFFSVGDAQVSGRVSGVIVEEQNAMFDLQSNIVDGDWADLPDNPNGIIVGVGIAEKLNLKIGDNLTATSSKGVSKRMKIVALYQTGNLGIDKSLAFVNLAAAQQLQRENAAYVTDIYVNIRDFSAAKKFVPQFEQMSGYKVEDWEIANASAAAANKMRKMMAIAISLSILLVAGFGIYNIMNMTVMTKMNDIAILKAIGFSGRDVVRIFVREAVVTGIIGIVFGLILAAVLIKLMGNVWVGGDIGYFPIRYFPQVFVLGVAFGFFVTTLAGYLPARKAASIDPIAIFRK